MQLRATLAIENYTVKTHVERTTHISDLLCVSVKYHDQVLNLPWVIIVPPQAR